MSAKLVAAPTGRLTINPDAQELFALHGLAVARDVLNLPGVVVNGHVGRNVSRVQLGNVTAYLKREHRVPFRTRWKNVLAGFGFVSLSEREAVVLKFLGERGLCGPEWLAYGECEGEAFLLVRGVDRSPLSAAERGLGGEVVFAASPFQRQPHPPAPSPRRRGGAREVARAVARLHAAGVHQPDLFFKHVLTDAAGKITILDWQQARLAKVTTAKQRARSLAALCATTPDDIGRTERLRFLKTYLTAFGQRDWKPFARQILALAADLRKRPGIRRQLGQAEVAQPLVRIHGETVCAIPAVADDLRSEAVIRQLHDATRSTPPAMLPAGTHWTARAYSRILASVRGRRWRSPELKLARLVMHLERYGIPAPRIVAYGQTPISAFVAYGQSPAGDAMPLPELVRKLHASGVVLRELPASATPFAVADGMAVIRDPACFQLAKRPTAKQRARAAG